MDYIAADFDSLAAGDDAFGRVLAALQETLSTLDRDLRSSLRQWEGEAAGAYWAAHDRWRGAADDMAARLTDLRRVITTARANYHNVVGTNVRMWGAT